MTSTLASTAGGIVAELKKNLIRGKCYRKNNNATASHNDNSNKHSNNYSSGGSGGSDHADFNEAYS